MNTNWTRGLVLRGATHYLCLALATTLTLAVGAAEASKKASAGKLETLIKKDPSNVKARESLAQIYYNKQRFKMSMNLLTPYSSDLSRKGLDLLARSCAKAQDSKCELRIRKILVNKYPSAPRELYMLALAEKRAELYPKAIANLRKMIELRPKAIEAHEQLLSIFKEQKNNYEARIIVLDMIKKFGEKSRLTDELCRIYTEEAFLLEAISTCQKAISQNSKNPDNHAYLAQSYLDKGQDIAAEKVLKASTKRFKKSELVQRKAGQFYLAKENYPVAARYFAQAVLSNRESAPAQIGLAQSNFAIGKYEQALIGYANACKMDRSTTQAFRKATAQLRIDRKYRLESQYSAKLYSCSNK